MSTTSPLTTKASRRLSRNGSPVELPSPGVWKMDPSHADIGFIARHLMVTKVRGRFTVVDATVTIDERIEDSVVEAVIDMASIDTGDGARDEHLRSSDFFDVDGWPRATFVSTEVDLEGGSGTMTGDLTIKGVTRPVNLQVEYLGSVTDPWGSERAVFEAHGRVNREDWGLTWNVALETGGVLVSKEITLEFHLQLVRQD